MDTVDWARLAVLSELAIKDYNGFIKMSEIEKLEHEVLLEKTQKVEEHPEDWDWGCLCQLCCSYGD